MKITKEIWIKGVLMEVKEFNSITHACEDAIQNSSELADIVGRLIDAAFNDEYKERHVALSYILGSGYQVEE